MAHLTTKAPSTKAELKAELELLEQRLQQRFEQRLDVVQEKLIETMRDMQTELLRGFAAHNTGLTLRMRKVEADQGNLDASVSPRLALVEQQVTDMNVRLMKLETR